MSTGIVASRGSDSGSLDVSLVRRLEHALQRRLGDLGEGRADLGLLRRRHPFGLDGRHTGFADAAQQRLAQVRVVDGCGRMVVEAAAYGLRMRPAPDHVGRAEADKLAARIWKLLR